MQFSHCVYVNRKTVLVVGMFNNATWENYVYRSRNDRKSIGYGDE